MEKFLLTAFLCASCYLHASDWCTLWEEAQNLYMKDQYQEALEIMDSINPKDIKSHPHLVIEKARILIWMKQHENALITLDQLEYKNLNKSDKIFYCQTKAIIYSGLKNLLGFEREMEEWKSLDPHFPIIEMTSDRIIIRNVPPCDCYKNIIKKVYEKHEVRFLPSDVCIIELTDPQCCAADTL